MSFQPVIPAGGYAGWTFLNRTREVQQSAFEASPQISRDVAAFEERIGSITSAEELVGDRQLLRVALGALAPARLRAMRAPSPYFLRFW